MFLALAIWRQVRQLCHFTCETGFKCDLEKDVGD